MKSKTFLVVVSALYLGLLPTKASAFTYGNPNTLAEIGKFYVGVAVSEFKRKFDISTDIKTSIGDVSFSDTAKLEISRQLLILGFGFTDNSTLEFSLGNMALEDEDGTEVDGNEFGVLFRILGFIASIRRADQENEFFEGDFTQIDLGYGFTKEIQDKFSLYGILLFSKISGDLEANSAFLSELSAELTFLFGFPVTATSTTQEFDEDTALGFVGGFDFNPEENLSIAFEIHALFETGFGLRFSLGF